MRDILITVLGFTVPAFAVSSMLAVGLSHTLRELIVPLRSLRLIVSAFAANFFFVPLLALSTAWLLELEEAFRTGLLLLAMAAGAPFLITLTASARGNMAMSAGLLALLLIITIFYMPLAAPVLIQGTTVSSSSIAWSLVTSMLIPLSLGLLISHFKRAWALRWRKFASKTSIVSLVILILSILGVHQTAILRMFGTGSIIAALLLTIGAFATGYILSGPERDVRGVVGLATSQRNVAAASVVAAQDFEHPDVLVMVIVTSLVALFLLFPVSWLLRMQNQKTAKDKRSPGLAIPSTS